jgi:hypothetical protein
MRRLFPAILLTIFALGCPQPVEGPMGAVQPTVEPPANQQAQGGPINSAPSGALPPPNVGSSDQIKAPPGLDSVPADQLQKAIGALNGDAMDVKAAILAYVQENGQSGSLTFDNGDGGTVTAQFVRTHDPVRYQEGKGYIGLSDFQAPSADPDAFYQLAFWLKKDSDSFQVFEVDLQAFPAKRGGQWVRMELFTVNDTFAKPLQ